MTTSSDERILVGLCLNCDYWMGCIRVVIIRWRSTLVLLSALNLPNCNANVQAFLSFSGGGMGYIDISFKLVPLSLYIFRQGYHPDRVVFPKFLTLASKLRHTISCLFCIPRKRNLSSFLSNLAASASAAHSIIDCEKLLKTLCGIDHT